MPENILGVIPSTWGKKFEAREGAIAHIRVEPGTIGCVANAHYFINFLSPQDRKMSLNSDARLINLAAVGSIEIVPEKSDYFSSWQVHKESLLIAITNERLRSLAGMEHDCEDFELAQLRIGLVDQNAFLISQHIKHEMLNENIGHGEYLDALLTLFGVHILRHYSSLGRKNARVHGGGLSPAKWKQVNDYIMAHLSESLSLETMAKAALLSPSHFSRAFKKTVGLTPHQYVMKMRLLIAKDILSKVDAPYSEIAAMAGFADKSHMTAAMKKAWGITPRQAKRELKG